MAMPLTNETDAALLRQFVRDRSEAALRCLTERHLNLVFGTAFRRVGDHGAAQEICQNVFIALVRKAAWLQNEGSLAGWLHRTTVLEARQWWRGESRRRQREQIAAQLETTMKTSDENAPAMAGALDEALLELREGDRQAVLLRFFEGRNHREIGAALGIGEDAARKRVDKALDQLMASFRKRGFAVGSAATVAACLTGAANGAPAGLVTLVVKAATTSAMPTTPWLAKLLGLGRGQLAGVCLVTLLIPAVWQEARLISARAEQRRMEAMLAMLQSQREGVTKDLAAVQRQANRALTEAAALKSHLASGDMGSSDLEGGGYLWEEKADYVRVPKAVMGRIRFDGSKDRSGLEAGFKQTLDKERGQVSPTVLGALGLSALEQARVQQLFSEHLNAYRDWAATNSHLTEFASITAMMQALPTGMTSTQYMQLNNDTRVWVTPSAQAGGEAWREQFQQELAAVIGSERAKVLLTMSMDDGSLWESLRQFGAEGALLVVTPRLEGGLRVCQNTKTGWEFFPGSFSEVLEPVAVEPFDEAAARKEISQRIEQRHAQVPDEEIPSLENLLEQSRKDWNIQQEIDQIKKHEHLNLIQMNLGHPLPQPVIDYLRQWRAAHPEVADFSEMSNSPNHP